MKIIKIDSIDVRELLKGHKAYAKRTATSEREACEIFLSKVNDDLEHIEASFADFHTFVISPQHVETDGVVKLFRCRDVSKDDIDVLYGVVLKWMLFWQVNSQFQHKYHQLLTSAMKTITNIKYGLPGERYA